MDALENFKSGIFALVIIGIIVAAGAITLTSFREDIILSQATSTVVNESITLSDGVAVNLANNWVVSVTQILVNATGAYQNLGDENYTLGSTNSENVGTITLDESVYDTNVSLVTYTYRDEFASVQHNATNEGLIGAYNASSYLGTIGTLLGVAALILIVLGAFYIVRR